MTASVKHNGWLFKHNEGLLAAVRNTAKSGASVLATNTALGSVLVGTPVTPALAVDSVVISNNVASGDILVAAASSSTNSQAYIWIDASAGTLNLYGAGTATTIISSTAVEIEDGILLALGNDQDQVLLNRTTTLAAATTLTGVALGTPVKPAIAANSLIVSNVTADGDILVLAQTGGNSQAWMWVDASAGLLTLYGAGVATLEITATTLVVNEASADINTRVETNGMAYALYADGGKDSVVIGSNTDTSSADELVVISRAARTATANTNYYDLSLAPAGAVTVPAGTTAVVATVNIAEPNITATGTVTAAATVRIVDAPTEGSSNYALWVDAGVTRLDGNLDMGDSALDILMKAATAAALEISDGTTKFYAFDTRVGTAGVTTHSLGISAYTFASGATNVATALSLAAHTLNYTGNTQVTSEVITASVGARTIAGDTATLTVDKASTLKLVAPTEGTNVAITAASALRIADAGGTPVNQYGIFIESLTVGATANYAIWVAGANAVHLGTAGSATGKMEISGATSGTVTVTVAGAAGTWTMTLPAAVAGAGGYQLADAAADGVCSWTAAASLRELKNVLGKVKSPQAALDKMLSTDVYRFHYKEGKGTGDTETEYVGVMADEAPWAMHYKGGIVNPVNTLGYTVLAFKAMAEKIAGLERQLATR